MKNKMTTLQTDIDIALKSIEDFVSPADKNYLVSCSPSSTQLYFKIQHKERNWVDFVTVVVSLNNETTFSHGSGGWNSGFTPIEILDSTITCFNIAKDIINHDKDIKELFKHFNKLSLELSKIKREALDEKEKIAYEKITNELSKKYIKMSHKELLKTLKEQPYVTFIRPYNYDRETNTFKTEIFNIANFNYETSDRLNLYVTNPDNPSTYYRHKTSIKKVEHCIKTALVYTN